MSTQETAALIESVNNMTATVAGKMGEIDQKVDEATASVPSTIKNMSNQTFYVDCNNGNDSNDGLSIGNAKKTIKALQYLMIPGGLYDVNLSVGEHYIDSVSFLGDVRFRSMVSMSQYNVASAIMNNQVITSANYTIVTVRKSLNVAYRIEGRGVVNFYNCLLKNDLSEGQYAGMGGPVGRVTAACIVAPSVQFSISGYESDDYDVPLTAISGFGGNTLTSVGWETMATKGKINKLIGGNDTAKGLLALASNVFVSRSLQSDGTTSTVVYDASDFKGVIGS